MARVPYTKPALTYSGLLQQLIDRGLIINDRVQAEHKLQHYNYCRLGGYWLPFEKNHTTHEFEADTTFDEILRLYEFDRRLRLVIFDAIERIEVSIRTKWAYHLGHNHGSHAHMDKSIAKDGDRWDQQIIQLKGEVDRSDEVFIVHLREKYEEYLPPVWAVCEIMTLGTLSRWYSNLKPLHTKQAIANDYDLRTGELRSWLRHLTIVRNLCAHHSRLWNRDFSRLLPHPPRNRPVQLLDEFMPNPQLYNSFLILLHMMSVLMVGDPWRNRLVTLLSEHEDYLPVMGFPPDWQTKSIWN